MGITYDDVHEFVLLVDRWSFTRYMSEWTREAGAEKEPDIVDAEHAATDAIGVAWRRQLDVVVAGSGIDAAQVARDIHAWGAAEAESARRSANSHTNPGRPDLRQVQLDGETESQAARLRWVRPLLDLVNVTA